MSSSAADLCRFVLISIVFFDAVLVQAFDFDHITAKTTEEIQAKTAKEAIRRLVPERADMFDVRVRFDLSADHKDTFHIRKLDDGTVLIEASTGVAAASGFHHYLKYYCGCHVSWDSQQLRLPATLPNVNETVRSKDRFRYYQNVCTSSYSFAWWNWDEWEPHIDWMAFNGINLPLAFTSQEAIWLRVYRRLNLTDGEIDEHFAGPAFFAWARMGNLRGWAGPLNENWHNFTLVLQHRILDRMRDFGMVPVVPSFAGHVPRAMKRIYPNSTMVPLAKWNNFEDKYCCPYMVDPTDPLFERIGRLYLTEYASEFGTNHMYSCDPFNEMTPSDRSKDYLRNVSASIFDAMVGVDPHAIWVFQNWLFVHDFPFWTRSRSGAFLKAVPIGRMLVLDLQSEQFPKYRRLKSYFGQPFVWCMLHNFGGTLGLFGSVDIINKEVFDARAMDNSTMVGVGLTPEGIHQNYAMYDLMLEMGWRDGPVDLSEWFGAFGDRRYGKRDGHVHTAFDFLAKSVYNFTGTQRMRGKYAINRLPRLNIKTVIWYDPVDLIAAWDNMIFASASLSDSANFRHDLVDVTRQVLQVLGDEYYVKLVASFRQKELNAFRDYSIVFMKIFDDLERILATDEAFLLGKWLRAAKKLAVTDEERKQYEYNARNQITLWGPNGEIHDYASKQWSGMVSHVFKPRWKLFVDAMNVSLETGARFNEDQTVRKIFVDVEQPFTFDRSEFPVTAQGDSIEIARAIHKDWTSVDGTWPLRPASVSEIVPMSPSRSTDPPDGTSFDPVYSFSTPDVVQT